MSNLAIYDELDQSIDFLFAHPDDHPEEEQHNLDPQLREFIQIARELRQLPRPEFRAQLRLQLGWQAAGRPVTNEHAVASVPVNEDAGVLPSLFGASRDLYPVRGANFAASLALHAVMALVIALGVFSIRSARVKPQPNTTVTELTSYIPPAGLRAPHGGGGGGDLDKIAASKGETPRSEQQLTPPVVVIANQKSRLMMEPTIVGPDHVKLPSRSGEPLARLMTPSSGVGFAGGIGSGHGGGVGSGGGPGHGPGTDGGFGGGFYSVGNGVTAPRAIYTPEPDYSDEARKARFQGMVVLNAIIGPDGRPRNLTVARSLGMGLDEKAIAAVRNWKFEPGTKDGHPVAVQIGIEVNFHLY